MKPRPDAVDIGDMDIDGTETMVVDCDRCAVRGDSCAECVIGVLFGAPPAVEWDADEQRAIDALIEAGLVPRLSMLPIVPSVASRAHHRRPA
jgi:hypothetical protein